MEAPMSTDACQSPVSFKHILQGGISIRNKLATHEEMEMKVAKKQMNLMQKKLWRVYERACDALQNAYFECTASLYGADSCMDFENGQSIQELDEIISALEKLVKPLEEASKLLQTSDEGQKLLKDVSQAIEDYWVALENKFEHQNLTSEKEYFLLRRKPWNRKKMESFFQKHIGTVVLPGWSNDPEGWADCSLTEELRTNGFEDDVSSTESLNLDKDDGIEEGPWTIEEIECKLPSADCDPEAGMAKLSKMAEEADEDDSNGKSVFPSMGGFIRDVMSQMTSGAIRFEGMETKGSLHDEHFQPVGHVEVQNWSSGVSSVSTGSGDNSDAQNSARTSPPPSVSTSSGHSSDDERKDSGLSSKTSSPPSVCSQGAGQHRETPSTPVASTSYSDAVKKGTCIYLCVFFPLSKMIEQGTNYKKKKKKKKNRLSALLVIFVMCHVKSV
jgi:exonuclease VII small subunit